MLGIGSSEHCRATLTATENDDRQMDLTFLLPLSFDYGLAVLNRGPLVVCEGLQNEPHHRDITSSNYALLGR